MKTKLMDAVDDLDYVVNELHVAQERIKEAQATLVEFGSPLWHALETIDDRINDALCKLGD